MSSTTNRVPIRSALWIGLAAVLIALPVIGRAATYAVGVGAGCTHATLQAAVAAAAANPGAHTIRLTRSVSHTLTPAVTRLAPNNTSAASASRRVLSAALTNSSRSSIRCSRMCTSDSSFELAATAAPMPAPSRAVVVAHALQVSGDRRLLAAAAGTVRAVPSLVFVRADGAVSAACGRVGGLLTGADPGGGTCAVAVLGRALRASEIVRCSPPA